MIIHRKVRIGEFSDVELDAKWLEKFRRRGHCGLEGLGKSSEDAGSKE